MREMMRLPTPAFWEGDLPTVDHPGARRGERRQCKSEPDLSFFPSHTEVLEGKYGPELVGLGWGKEGGRGPDVWSLPDFLASLCSLRTEMERIHQEQSKVRQKSGQTG